MENEHETENDSEKYWHDYFDFMNNDYPAETNTTPSECITVNPIDADKGQEGPTYGR